MDQPSPAQRPHSVQVTLTIRALLVVAALVLAVISLASITGALLLIFTGVFLAFVFEYPLRSLMRRTGLGRGLGATIVVLGSAIAVTLLGLLLLVPLLESIRDFLKSSPELVADLQDRLGGIGDSGAAGHVQDGAQQVSDEVPQALPELLGLAGELFSVALSAFTVLFVCLFTLIDMPKVKEAVASLLSPAQAELTLDVWERVTTTISRWAIGAGCIAIIAGTVQGTTAWLLGSEFALALGLIAGFLDLIPNLGATIAGFILVPTIWAEVGTTEAIIMAIVILVYQQVENNLLTPTIQRKATNIWALLVITSVTIFGALLGVLGALIAVPLTGSIQIVVEQLTQARRERMAAMKAAIEETAVEPSVAEPVGG